MWCPGLASARGAWESARPLTDMEPLVPDDVISQKVAYLLNLCDQDGDGVLETSDFETWVARLAAIRGWEAGSAEYAGLEDVFLEAYKAVQAAHGGDNGVVDVADMTVDLVALARARSENFSVWGDAMFRLIDADGDGTIGPDEYGDLMESVGIDRATRGEAFARLDLNGDGTISKEEFERLYLEFFTSEDPEAPGSAFWGPAFATAAG
jgi:Ca2+-binding EF-hand superfamily protein